MRLRWPTKVYRGCAGKVRHPSQGKADAAIRSMIKRDLPETDTLNSYWCVRCRHWHIGNRADEFANR